MRGYLVRTFESKLLTWLAVLALVSGAGAIAALLWGPFAGVVPLATRQGEHISTSAETIERSSVSKEVDSFRRWRIQNDAERKRREDSGVYDPSRGPGFAFVDQDFKVLPSALDAAGAPEAVLPQLQVVVDRAWSEHSRNLAARLERLSDRAGCARYRIWTSRSEGERILDKVHSEFISIAGENAGEKLMEALRCAVRSRGDGFGLLDIEIEEVGATDGESPNSYHIVKYHAYNGEPADSYYATPGTDEFRQRLGAEVSLLLAPTEP